MDIHLHELLLLTQGHGCILECHRVYLHDNLMEKVATCWFNPDAVCGELIANKSKESVTKKLAKERILLEVGRTTIT